MDKERIITIRMSIDDLLTMAFAVISLEVAKTIDKNKSRQIVGQIEKAIRHAHVFN